MSTNKMTRSLLVIVCVLSGLCVLVVHSQPATSKDSQHPPDPESLPPDTFRKLAQALYHRGDKEENRLQRKFFYNSSITCNDGSVAGYYIRRNYQSKKWIVFLEGGWICHDPMSCLERAAREKHRMSSDRWQTVKSVGGILSADPEENPHFADANHVFVPYCSSDSWSGTASHQNQDGHSFMGRQIVQEVIRELSDFQQLLFGEELFLAGSSAGGTGVLVNVDFVSGMVAKHGVRVRGIVDSGWFLDNDPFTTDSSSVIQSLKQGIKLWQANVNDDCAKNYPGELWECYIGYKAFPFIKTPLFIFQWQFDRFQLYADNVAVPASPDQWNYIHGMGSNLRSTFSEVSAVFSPACIAHEVITKMEWTEVQVDGVTLPDALWCWSSSLPDAVNYNLEISSIIQEPHRSNAPKISSLSNEVLSNADDNRQRAMLADAPRRLEQYKLASNLVRSIQPDDAESKNSLNTRLHKKKYKHKVVDNRTGSFESRKEEKRRRRRRKQRQIQKCKEGNEVACKKLKQLEDEEEALRANSDLIRSLDRRSSRKNNDGKATKLTKEQRRELRRERKRLKKLAKRRRRLLRQQERKKNKKNNSNRSARSITSSSQQCRTKFIDSCSWPHCNRSCPKLKNPETGQEIDFLSLLKSFGLEMGSVARAIGVDINTLNNMDKGVLLELLTSQGNNGN